MPRVTFAGSKAHVKHVRNFRYPTVETPIPAYYDATYDIDTLTGVDLVCSYWMGKAIAHVLVSFAFADGRHLAISIETRRRRGQVYSVIAGFFHHYQLMFVIADERDLIGVRTDPRGEEAYIYPLRTTVSEAHKRLLRGYLAKAEALAETAGILRYGLQQLHHGKRQADRCRVAARPEAGAGLATAVQRLCRRIRL